MRTLAKSIIAAGAFAIAAFLLTAPAFAQTSTGMTVCNQSPDPLATAIGYHSPGVNDPADHSVLTGLFVTRGWLRIDPGACHTFQNPFGARYMYWYGWTVHSDGSEAMSADVAMKNPLSWCVQYYAEGDRPFTFEVENTKSEDASNMMNNCSPFGNEPKGIWVIFNLVDTWVDSKANFTGQ